MSKEIEDKTLLQNIRKLIEESRQQMAVAVNATITTLYWHIGKKINEAVAHFKVKPTVGKLSLHCGDNCIPNMETIFQKKICAG